MSQSDATIIPHEALQLGQFIPLHYHHQMLNDDERTGSFKRAIDALVPIGGVALELGGGTGVLSFFAVQRARKVYCVERNPELYHAAEALFKTNVSCNRIELVNMDAFQYLPPEPVDVVICEMLHSALLREKQLAVIESFKQRYEAKFGLPLPRFIPEATLLAAQPVQQNYTYHGYQAPVPVFDHPYSEHPRTAQLASPQMYSLIDYSEAQSGELAMRASFTVETDGTCNAMRFITKNVLGIDNGAVVSDWHNQYLVLPLLEPIQVVAGDVLHVEFAYRAGAQLHALGAVMKVRREREDVVVERDARDEVVSSRIRG